MPAIKLSLQPNKGYKKSIGFHVGKDGVTRKQKVFYLGNDKALAAYLAERITEAWRQLKSDGNKVWTEDALAEILQLRQGIERNGVSPPTNAVDGSASNPGSALTMPPVSVGVKDLTSHAAIEIYRAEISDSPRIGDGHMVNLNLILHDLRRNLPDVQLEQLGRTEVMGLIHHYMRRPKSLKTKRSISADTAH